MQFNERFIEVEGRKIWTKSVLQEDSEYLPTIVFLHDALGSVEQWKDFPIRLGELTGLNVMMYDRFGHGLSDPEPLPPDNDFLDHEALVILPEVLYQLEISKSILLGHSDGGTIALIYAAHINTQALILEAAHVLVEEITRQGVLQATKSEVTLVPKLRKYHGDKATALFKYWSDLWSSDLMKDWNIEHILERVDMPTLVIQGEDDNYGTLSQVQKIRDGVGGECETLILPDCSHAPHKEWPEIVIAKINSFIGRYGLIEG
jgi:pimeloyl-ACP methyl ester carboxylesterase